MSTSREILNIPPGGDDCVGPTGWFFYCEIRVSDSSKKPDSRRRPTPAANKDFYCQPGGILLGDLSAGDSGYLLEALTLEDPRFDSFHFQSCSWR